MKKYLSFICIVFICINAYGQDIVLDSIAIKFKANLFTISEYGVASKERIIEDIENQEVQFLKTKYKNFMFLKIRFSQPYRTSENGFRTLDRDCYYYIGYNIPSKRFYRLGGFDSVDIDAFIKDLESLELANIFDWEDRNEIEDIDIDCLYNYHHLSKRKRLKQKFDCFKNCAEDTRTYYIEH